MDVSASTELTGHADQISAIAGHPTNPNYIATGALDKTVRLWDLRTKKSTSTITTPGANINLAYHPDGCVIAVGDKNENVSLLDGDRGVFLHTIKNGTVDREEVCILYSPKINELAWSPDGSMLLLPMGSGNISFLRTPDTPASLISDPKEICPWDLHPNWTRDLVRPTHPAAIFCIKWDRSGRLVATAAADSTINLWDAFDWTSRHIFSSFKFPSRSIDFSSDGEWLAAGGEDTEISLVSACYDSLQMSTASERIVHQIQVTATINTLAWHPFKPLLAYGGTETTAIYGSNTNTRSTPIWLYSVP